MTASLTMAISLTMAASLTMATSLPMTVSLTMAISLTMAASLTMSTAHIECDEQMFVQLQAVCGGITPAVMPHRCILTRKLTL